MNPSFSRRGLIAAALSSVALPAFARERGVAEVVDLPVGARSTKLHVWRPSTPRGIALLSTGYGAWPERYAQRLVPALTDSGFAVYAPVHVDSMRHPDRAKFTMQASFMERFADQRAALARAVAAHPELPVIAVGHSYGSLISLCLGGALARVAPLRLPEVRAALGFSTPARIPGLIAPTVYESLEVPAMVVTGSEDTLPAEMGYGNAPADHLLPIEMTKRRGYALVVDGADHALVDAPAFERARPALALFLAGHGLGDRRAAARLAAWRPNAPDRFIVRGS
jgi:pimeloyl-ACP methyl ester carboxylesterase